MSQIKFTKNELRDQQGRLSQLNRYLPTLQLKKAMLQAEVLNARAEVEERQRDLHAADEKVDHFAPLMEVPLSFDISLSGEVTEVDKRYENIAGVDIPSFEGITFAEVSYSLFDTPPWVDGAVTLLRERSRVKVIVDIAEEKCGALEKELRDVSIRVNLFEKVLIPRAQGNIKRIKVFLGDQELAAVGQAKVAKGKIIKRKEKHLAR